MNVIKFAPYYKFILNKQEVQILVKKIKKTFIFMKITSQVFNLLTRIFIHIFTNFQVNLLHFCVKVNICKDVQTFKK